jgi:hypothetical protein
MLSVTFRISVRGKVYGGRRSIELAVTGPRASNGVRRGLFHPDPAITHRQPETLRHGLLEVQYCVRSQYGSQRSPTGSGRTSQSVFSHRTSGRQTSKTGSVGALSRPTPIDSQTTTHIAGSSLVISTAGCVWGFFHTGAIRLSRGARVRLDWFGLSLAVISTGRHRRRADCLRTSLASG